MIGTMVAAASVPATTTVWASRASEIASVNRWADMPDNSGLEPYESEPEELRSGFRLWTDDQWTMRGLDFSNFNPLGNLSVDDLLKGGDSGEQAVVCLRRSPFALTEKAVHRGWGSAVELEVCPASAGENYEGEGE